MTRLSGKVSPAIVCEMIAVPVESQTAMAIGISKNFMPEWTIGKSQLSAPKLDLIQSNTGKTWRTGFLDAVRGLGLSPDILLSTETVVEALNIADADQLSITSNTSSKPERSSARPALNPPTTVA